MTFSGDSFPSSPFHAFAPSVMDYITSLQSEFFRRFDFDVVGAIDAEDELSVLLCRREEVEDEDAAAPSLISANAIRIACLAFLLETFPGDSVSDSVAALPAIQEVTEPKCVVDFFLRHFARLCKAQTDDGGEWLRFPTVLVAIQRPLMRFILHLSQSAYTEKVALQVVGETGRAEDLLAKQDEEEMFEASVTLNFEQFHALLLGLAEQSRRTTALVIYHAIRLADVHPQLPRVQFRDLVTYLVEAYAPVSLAN